MNKEIREQFSMLVETCEEHEQRDAIAMIEGYTYGLIDTINILKNEN